MAEYIITTKSDSSTVQKPLPARQSETCCLCRRALSRFAIAGRSCVFCVTGHSRRFDRRSKNKIIGSLNVKEPGLFYVMLMFKIWEVWCELLARLQNLMEPIEIVDRCCQVEPMPRPIKAEIGSPLQIPLVRDKSGDYTAAQFDLGI